MGARPGSAARRRKKRTLLARYGNRCCYCGREFSDELPSTFEHVTTLYEGGTWRNENLRLACNPCNQARGDMTAPVKPPGVVIARSRCVYCEQPIQQEAFDNARVWRHTDTGKQVCTVPRFATPEPE